MPYVRREASVCTQLAENTDGVTTWEMLNESSVSYTLYVYWFSRDP